MNEETSGGMDRCNKRLAGSITVTLQPRDTADAATSSPINPPPSTADSRAWHKRFAQPTGIGYGANVMQLHALINRPAKTAPTPSGPHQQTLITNPRAIAEMHALLHTIDRRHSNAEPHLDTLLRVPAC